MTNLPAITTGTEKQNEFANDVRNKIFTDFEAFLVENGATLEQFTSAPEAEGHAEYHALLNHDDAVFWINKKGNTLLNIIRGIITKKVTL